MKVLAFGSLTTPLTPRLHASFLHRNAACCRRLPSFADGARSNRTARSGDLRAARERRDGRTVLRTIGTARTCSYLGIIDRRRQRFASRILSCTQPPLSGRWTHRACNDRRRFGSLTAGTSRVAGGVIGSPQPSDVGRGWGVAHAHQARGARVRCRHGVMVDSGTSRQLTQ